ncbi:hypothetical protein B566_EDAN017672 [Ephemera danica]|nr:hypothetical protein B566_EDAN017672 [Ephemera danica]
MGPVEERVHTPNSIHALFGEDLADSKNVAQNNTQVDADHFFSKYQLSIEQPSNPIMWLADWLTINNPQPNPKQ